MAICNEIITKVTKISHRKFPNLVQKKYLYAKYMAYTLQLANSILILQPYHVDQA